MSSPRELQELVDRLEMDASKLRFISKEVLKQIGAPVEAVALLKLAGDFDDAAGAIRELMEQRR